LEYGMVEGVDVGQRGGAERRLVGIEDGAFVLVLVLDLVVELVGDVRSAVGHALSLGGCPGSTAGPRPPRTAPGGARDRPPPPPPPPPRHARRRHGRRP